MSDYFAPSIRDLRAQVGSSPALFLLTGPLGAGKTTFVKEFLASYGLAPTEVQSPTFLKLLEYEVPGEGLCLHLDLYRLDSVRELERLSLESYEDTRFVFVEWPQYFLELLQSRPDLQSLYGQKYWDLNFQVTPERALSLQIKTI